MQYVATFHTELSALRTQRQLHTAGASARRAPVPRVLSASCGTCVFYEADDPHIALMDADYQAVYQLDAQHAFCLVQENL